MGYGEHVQGEPHGTEDGRSMGSVGFAEPEEKSHTWRAGFTVEGATHGPVWVGNRNDRPEASRAAVLAADRRREALKDLGMTVTVTPWVQQVSTHRTVICGPVSTALKSSFGW